MNNENDNLLAVSPAGDPALRMEEAVEERSPTAWGLHFDWDWQRFLWGGSFERRKYVAINLGFLCVLVAKDRWDPWF